MVAIIMLCALVCTVPLVLICGAITPATPPPIITAPPPAIIEPAQRAILPGTIDEEDENMKNETIMNNLREGVIERSIEVLRRNGISEEEIKKKLTKSFSLDKETMDRLFAN